jgi:hypothetical protein
MSCFHCFRLHCLRRSLLCSTIAAACAVAAVACSAIPAAGGTVFMGSGTSAAGRPLALQATLSISGDMLTVMLENISPVDSVEAADVLSSFYFDVASGTSRPTLGYYGASGYVYKVRKGTNDLEYRYTPQTFTQVSAIASNLKAVNPGDASWQFLPMDPAFSPGLGFGVGTVANHALSPNGFTPNIVGPPGNGMINFAIYRGGDINPSGVLDGKYLVKNRATFWFTGLNGYTEAHIGPRAVFGLGTGPDSIVVVPEPSAIVIATGVVMLAVWGAWPRARRKRPGTDTPPVGHASGVPEREPLAHDG